MGGGAFEIEAAVAATGEKYFRLELSDLHIYVERGMIQDSSDIRSGDSIRATASLAWASCGDEKTIAEMLRPSAPSQWLIEHIYVPSTNGAEWIPAESFGPGDGICRLIVRQLV
mgnify:CR=1 FL=1